MVKNALYVLGGIVAGVVLTLAAARLIPEEYAEPRF